MSRKEWVNVSDCPYSGDFLIYLLDNQKVKKSDFQKFTGSQTAKQVLEFLESKGLISYSTITSPRFITIVNLTEKGRQKARLFQDIDSDESASAEPVILESSSRMEFLKKPCGDVILLTLLNEIDMAASDLESICKDNAKYVKERLKEAESLGFILRLGRGSEARYSLTEEGRDAAENLERYKDCMSPPGRTDGTSATSSKDSAT